MDAAGLDRPVIEKAVGARSTPPEGDVVGTHNGLRSHGCFRCLVIRLRRTHWSGFRQIPTGGEFEMSKRVQECNGAVKQGGSKNGERENSERTFSVSACNPQGCARTPIISCLQAWLTSQVCHQHNNHFIHECIPRNELIIGMGRKTMG